MDVRSSRRRTWPPTLFYGRPFCLESWTANGCSSSCECSRFQTDRLPLRRRPIDAFLPLRTLRIRRKRALLQDNSSAKKKCESLPVWSKGRGFERACRVFSNLGVSVRFAVQVSRIRMPSEPVVDAFSLCSSVCAVRLLGERHVWNFVLVFEDPGFFLLLDASRRIVDIHRRRKRFEVVGFVVFAFLPAALIFDVFWKLKKNQIKRIVWSVHQFKLKFYQFYRSISLLWNFHPDNWSISVLWRFDRPFWANVFQGKTSTSSGAEKDEEASVCIWLSESSPSRICFGKISFN